MMMIICVSIDYVSVYVFCTCVICWFAVTPAVESDVRVVAVVVAVVVEV